MINDVAYSATLSPKPARTDAAAPAPQVQRTAVPVDQRVVRDLNPVKAEEAENNKPAKMDVQEAVDRLNKAVQHVSRDIYFTTDKDTGIDVITVLDQKTHEVIRQFPPEEIVNLAKKLDDVRGVLFEKKV